VNSAIIQLDEVSLCYRLARHRVTSLKDYAIHWMTSSLRYDQLWALSEMSVSIERGENVGIVGRNGAGKSTLLKVISRVLKPTSGRAVIRGRVAPILGLGTGFDFELTGRENIFLNALLLGHTYHEIAERLSDVIAFSGIGDFIDSPVRNYSSGMVARLGFSIATAWTPDVLILDEVLSVGDEQFKQQCAARLEQFRNAGTTIVIVSHAAGEIVQNCTRCIWLEKGKLQGDGHPNDVLAQYTASVSA